MQNSPLVHRRSFANYAFFLASLLLAGCQTTGTVSNDASTQAVHLPPNYQQMIAQQIRMSSEYQSIGIKDAQISNPILQFGDILNGGTVASICVRYRVRGYFHREYSGSFAT